jgi:hypothetical protein
MDDHPGNGTYVVVSKEDALIQPLAAAHGRDSRAGDNPGDFGRQIHIRSAPRPAISKARRALSTVSAMLMRRSEGCVDRPLTDSFASYLPGGWTLYIGSMVEPVRRPSLTSRHRRFKRLAASSEPQDLRKGIGRSLSPSARGNGRGAAIHALSSSRLLKGSHVQSRERTLRFQVDTVAQLQETRDHTLLSFRSV